MEENMEIEEINRPNHFVQSDFAQSFTANFQEKTLEKSLEILPKKSSKYKCVVCYKSFKKPSVLAIHMHSHTKEKPFKCDVCGKGFSQKNNLNVHLRIHTGETFAEKDAPETIENKVKTIKLEETEEISQTFTDNFPGNLLETITDNFMGNNTENSEIPPNSIRNCVGNFTETFTENALEIQPENLTKLPGKHQCEVCHKMFKRPSVLAIHMLTHTKEKPFKCDVCEKRFSQKNNLKVHLRIHTGEMPFQCEICGKGFSLKCNYEEHTRTHTNERPFHCELCDKSYQSKKMLKEKVINTTAMA